MSAHVVSFVVEPEVADTLALLFGSNPCSGRKTRKVGDKTKDWVLF